MTRCSKDDYFLSVALAVSKRATCPRRSVGCVIVDTNGHIMATGYNGVPKGYPHCLDTPCGGENEPSGQGLEKCMAIHAEQNALLYCKSISEIQTIYCTTMPCFTCAKLIANTSCKEVIYIEGYPSEKTLDLFNAKGVLLLHKEGAIKMTTDKENLLTFADSLEWQPIETAPYEEQPTGKKLTILLRNKFRVAFGVWDNQHMDYLVDGAMPIPDVWKKTDPILWMHLPTGEAAAVIRELVECLDVLPFGDKALEKAAEQIGGKND